jgi:GT2 family glycosyltransferase/glycosyltransferase involved in cell wall biosynthesis
MTSSDLSAVLVAWNSGDSLRCAVDALRRSADEAGASLQIVIVDNNSTDGSVTDVTPGTADAVIRNPVNAGYATAAAQGTSLATGEWVLFINPDVLVDADFVPALLAAARDVPPHVATLVPELRFTSNPGVVNSRGVTVDDVGVPAEVDAGAAAEESRSPSDVFGGTTGCCLVRAQALRSVRGLEPCYFAYLDDVDLSQRLQRSGFGARFVSDAVAYHEGSASLGRGSAVKAYLVARNRRLFFRLHGPHTVRARFWRTIVETGHAAVSMLSGAGLAPLRGRMDALRVRNYTSFLLRSRALDDVVANPPYSPRTGLLETLRRKRTGQVVQPTRDAESPRPTGRTTEAAARGVPIVCLGFAEWKAEIPTNQHHLMDLLSRQSPVLFIESLGLRQPTASIRDLRRLGQRLVRGVRPLRDDGRVHVLSPLVVPYHRNDAVRRLNNVLLGRSVSRSARRLGFERPILWAYVPQALSLIDVLDPRLIVYHCVDDIAAHERIDEASFRDAELAFIDCADLVIASSEPLRARLSDRGANVRLMTNVADTELFSSALHDGPVDPAVEHLPRPRIVFVGAVSSGKVDLELVRDLARSRRGWSIVLVGPVGLGDPRTDISELRAEPNVHVLGPRPHEALPALLRGVEAAIIPYRINRLTSSVFPMKVYEYLAAGLPVVATPLPALADVNGVDFGSDALQTVRRLETLLAEDSHERRQERSMLASSHSWSARMIEIERAIAELPWRR